MGIPAETPVVLDEMVAQAPLTRKLLGLARDVAGADIGVLLTGETGTGKELLARAIHQASPRCAAPFVAVNCAGIPDTLLESELFGHEKGAFTDAHQARRGKFELADGGTLFLDEIGDMSLTAQAKVLRAVESKVVERVGGERPVRVNCRIIAATNKDLAQAVSRGGFREDLYYRLSEVRLHLPPLRERLEDLPGLVRYFIGQFNREFNKNVSDVSAVVMTCLSQYHWPGNIRELKNVIRVGMVLIKRDQLWLEDLPFRVHLVPSDDGAKDPGEVLALDEVQKAHIGRVLERCEWNKVRAAQLLKISRPTLDRKIRKYGLKEQGGGA